MQFHACAPELAEPEQARLVPGVALGLAEIRRARQLIGNQVLRTPLVYSPSLSAITGQPVHLKLECQQTTGSFKLRGVVNALAQLDPGVLQRGVVTASTGNHGRAVAYAASERGVRAVVCMSALVPANKIDAIRSLGAEARIVGCSQDDAQQEARRLSAQLGLVMIEPFDHPHVIAGQATIGLEIVEQLPDVAAVLIPLSGGGLFSGVALALKSLRPSIQAVGISMQAGCAMHASVAAGRPTLVEEVPTLADSLGGGIGLDNRYTFALVQALADEIWLVDEPAIAQGVRHAYFEEREVVEGAGAVGLAALLDARVKTAGLQGPIVVVLSGRNIDPRAHRQLVCQS